MTAIWSVVLIFLSMIGFADASYITYEEFFQVTSVCANIPGFDCGAVLDSPWAHIGPVPLSVLGMGFYAVMFGLAVYHLLSPQPQRLLTRLMLFSASCGLLFTIFLLYLQAFIIGAYCLFCMISATTSTLIFLSAGGYWWTQQQKVEQDDSDSQ